MALTVLTLLTALTVARFSSPELILIDAKGRLR